MRGQAVLPVKNRKRDMVKTKPMFPRLKSKRDDFSNQKGLDLTRSGGIPMCAGGRGVMVVGGAGVAVLHLGGGGRRGHRAAGALAPVPLVDGMRRGGAWRPGLGHLKMKGSNR